MYNAVTNTATGSLQSFGRSLFVPSADQTLTVGVGPRPPGVSNQYIKVVNLSLVEMTAGEKNVVDVTVATAASARSADAVQLARSYATIALLPPAPNNNLLVMINDVGTGFPGIAISFGGNWRVIS